jgi:hypothetical protein
LHATEPFEPLPQHPEFTLLRHAHAGQQAQQSALAAAAGTFNEHSLAVFDAKLIQRENDRRVRLPAERKPVDGDDGVRGRHERFGAQAFAVIMDSS